MNEIATPSGLSLAGMFVFLIAASTFARDGVAPLLQTDAIASAATVVACQVGTPNGPYGPYLATPLTIDSSSAVLVWEMSGPKLDE